MQPLEVFALNYADRLRAAQAWKAKGGKVVGYLCDNVPDELISAAGFFPLRVSGDPASGKDAVRTKVDRLYAPEVANRPDFTASMLNRLLDGTYGLLDYLIVPHNRNAIQSIYRELQDARANDGSVSLPVMHYLDKAWSPFYVAEVYNRDCIFELKAVLEGWSGKPISDAALSDAIAVADENRALLARVASLRAEPRPRLSGVQALQIIGTSMLMQKAEHNILLKQLLASADGLPKRNGPRLFVGGSPLDHTGVYEAIEACGATVVAEDTCWGNRSFDLPVGTAEAPILALAARFHKKPACSISFPLSGVVQGCARRVAASNADAAIFYVMDQDWTQNWETPNQVKAVKGQGTPSLHLSEQSYWQEDLGPLKAAVSSFLTGLKVGVPA